MPMTSEEALALVELLTRAYPTYPAEAGTIELYVGAIARCQQNVEDAATAVRDWIVGQPFFPKLNELIDAIGGVARRRAAEQRPQPLPGLPAEPGSQEFVRTQLAEARATLARARKGKPAKVYHCPTCHQPWPERRDLTDREARELGLGRVG